MMQVLHRLHVALDKETDRALWAIEGDTLATWGKDDDDVVGDLEL